MKSANVKAFREGYDEAPFYFTEEFQGSPRTVAWTDSVEQMKLTVLALVDSYPEMLAVLFKSYTERDSGDPWTRYLANVDRPRLRACLLRHDEAVFGSGYTQLCVRRIDTGDYFALDDHGMLFIYSRAAEPGEVCRDQGFASRTAPLIDTEAHWHRRPPGDEERIRLFITELGLKAIGAARF